MHHKRIEIDMIYPIYNNKDYITRSHNTVSSELFIPLKYC